MRSPELRSTGSSVTGASGGGTTKRLARMPQRSLDQYRHSVRHLTVRLYRRYCAYGPGSLVADWSPPTRSERRDLS